MVNENELMQDFLIGLMAAPQLAVFFEKFPRLRSILEGEIPSWRNRLERRIKETSVPEDLAHEFTLYQHQLGLQSADFFQQLTETLAILREHESPFIYEAESLCPDGATPRSISFQTLFLQRWRLSLIARTLTLHHQVLDEERELLQAELQQRMQISGALEPVLVDNENAAGKLWDLSKGELHHGDYQLMVQYGDFLAQQPELKNWLSSSVAAAHQPLKISKAPSKKWLESWYVSPPSCLKKSAGFTKATIFYVFCRLNSRC